LAGAILMNEAGVSPLLNRRSENILANYKAEF
jgi:hypothetical protein